MKKLVLAGLALPLLALCSCSGESRPPAAVASQAAPAPAATAPAVTAPTQQTTTPAPAAAAAAESPAQKSAANPAANSPYARKKSEAGDKNKLDTKYDLSKVKLDQAAAAKEDHDHDHAAEAGISPQDGGALLPAAQAEKNKGRIELTGDVQQVKDLGKLRQGESASFDFPFVSKGEEPLVITGVKPSCGCTKAEIVLVAEDGTRKPYVKGDPIAVGTEFLLESEISTDGKPGGPFSAQISIYGNDVRGAYNVRLTAEIEPVLSILPSPTVFFGQLTTADKREQTVTVSSTRGEPFLLTIGQETIQEPVKLEYTAKNPDAEGKSSEWTIHVVFGPNAQIGMRSYPVNFKSDLPIAHPKYPSQDGKPQTHGFMLNVQAQVSGMVSAEPSFLTFGMVRPGEPLERTLRIQCHDDFKLRGDLPVILEGLQGQELPFKDAISVAIEPVEDGKAANVKVLLKGMPADLNGSFGGVLRLKVGHPFMDELQIRFSGVCRPSLPPAVQPTGGQPTTQPTGQPK